MTDDRPDLADLAPSVGAAFGSLSDAVWDGRVDPGLLERCRSRVCALLGAPVDAGRHPSAPPSSPSSPGVDACVTFTEVWVIDPHQVSDEQAAAVRSHLGDAGSAAFTIALATIEAGVRTELALGSLR